MRVTQHQSNSTKTQTSKSSKAKNLGVQAKLQIGKPGDKYEREADAIADQIVALGPITSVAPGEKAIQRKCADCEKEELQRKPLVSEITPRIQRMDEEEENKLIQPKASNAPEATSSSFESHLSASKGGGSPLPGNTRGEMESKIGTDFSAVRVHTDSSAIQMSREIGAQAFTHGSDVYFNSGKYSPSSTEGKHLLAHELVHTVQQGSSNSSWEEGNSGSVTERVDRSLIQKQSKDCEPKKKLELFQVEVEGGPKGITEEEEKTKKTGLKQFLKKLFGLTTQEALKGSEVISWKEGSFDGGISPNKCKVFRYNSEEDLLGGLVKIFSRGSARIDDIVKRFTGIRSRLQIVEITRFVRSLSTLDDEKLDSYNGWVERLEGGISSPEADNSLLQNVQSHATQLKAFLSGDYSELIIQSQDRLDMLFVPVHLSREEISIRVFGSKKHIDAFDFADTSYLKQGEGDYPMRAIKIRRNDLRKLANKKKTEVHFARKLVQDVVTIKDQVTGTSLIEIFNGDQVAGIILEWSQFSDIHPIHGGLSYFDQFLDRLDQELGTEDQQGIVFILSEMTSLSDVAKKAILLRSKKFNKKVDFENSDRIRIKPEEIPHHALRRWIVGRFYNENLRSSQVLETVQVLAVGYNLDAVEIHTRNSPSLENYIRVVIPDFPADVYRKGRFTKEDWERHLERKKKDKHAPWIFPEGIYVEEKVHVGFTVAVGMQGKQDWPFSLEDFDYESEASDGNFNWYYPGTILIPPGRFKREFKDDNEILQGVRNQILEKALDKAIAWDDPKFLLALDYDTLRNSLSDTCAKNFESYKAHLYINDRKNYNYAVRLPNACHLAIIQHVLKNYKTSAMRAPDSIRLLTRLFSVIPKERFKEVEIFIKERKLHFDLIRLASSSSGELDVVFALGDILASLGLSSDDSEGEYTIDESVTYKIGKDEENDKYFMLASEITEGKGGTPLFQLKQMEADDSFFSDHRTTARSKELSSNTLVPVEIVGGTLQYMTALQLALVGEAMSAKLERDKEFEDFIDFLDIILIVVSVVAPITSLGRLIGAAAAKQFIKTGSLHVLKRIGQKFLTKKGMKVAARLGIEVSFILIETHKDEIRKLEGGKEFLALYNVVLLSVAARDIYKLAKSKLLEKLKTSGIEIISRLRNLGKIKEANKVIKAIAESTALANSGSKLSKKLLKKLNSGKPLTKAEKNQLRSVYNKEHDFLEKELRKLTIVPGTEEHKLLRWIDHQKKHPKKYPKVTNAIDPQWSKQYDIIIRNKRFGGRFEAAALKDSGYNKNNLEFENPKFKNSDQSAGFIPDSIKGDPKVVKWGDPYDFVEVKGWQDMSHTGNLKSMIEYVEEFGGSIEVIFRSGKPFNGAVKGATKLSRPLMRKLRSLHKAGRAKIRRYP